MELINAYVRLLASKISIFYDIQYFYKRSAPKLGQEIGRSSVIVGSAAVAHSSSGIS